MMNYAAAGYTHTISLERHVPHLGWMPQAFHTTPDAVALHMCALAKQERHGDVRNVQVQHISQTLAH
jgi:hypothetical protein